MKKRSILFFGGLLFLLLFFLLLLIPIGSSSITFTFSANGKNNYVNFLSENFLTGKNPLERAWENDTVTTRTLDARASITTTDASPHLMNHRNGVCPADWVAFHGTTNQFYLYVYAFTGTSCTIRFACTYIDGTTGNNDIVVATTGTYNIVGTNPVKQCTTSQIIAFTGTPKSISYKVNQSRAGLIYKNSPSSYTLNDTGIYMGTSFPANHVDMLLENLTIFFDCSQVGFTRYLILQNGANSDLTIKNCTVNARTTPTYGGDYAISLGGNSFVAKNSEFRIPVITTTEYGAIGAANQDVFLNLTSCNLLHLGVQYGCTNLEDVTMMFTPSAAFYYNNIFRIDGCTIRDSNTSVWLYYDSTGTYTNMTLIDNDYLALVGLPNTVTEFRDSTTDNYNLFETYYGGFDTGGRLDWNYTVKARMKNNASGNLSGMIVDIYNESGTKIMTKVSSANGMLTNTVLTDRYWTSMTPVYCNPYTFRCHGAGYQNLNVTIVVDQRLNLTLVMLANITCPTSGLVAIENIVNAVGTHEYEFRPLLGVNGEWWIWANYTGTSGSGTIVPLMMGEDMSIAFFVIGGIIGISTGLIIRKMRRKKDELEG